MEWGTLIIAFIGGSGFTKLLDLGYKAIWGKKNTSLGNQATEVDIVEKYRKMLLDTDVLVDELKSQNSQYHLREISLLRTITELAEENKRLKNG